MGALAVPVVSGAGPAAAATPSGPPPIAQRSAQGVTADALPTVQIDGVVWSLAVVGNTVYAGRQFRERPSGGRRAGHEPDAAEQPAVLQPDHGHPEHLLRAVAQRAGHRRYGLSGRLAHLRGRQLHHRGWPAARRIAAYSTATGQLISSFAPNLDASVNAIAATNTHRVRRRKLLTANGVARSKLAAFSAADGSLLGWAPTADNSVKAMALTPDGSRVIVGGMFLNLNGSPAAGLGALDATSGALLPWAATNLIKEGGSAPRSPVCIPTGRRSTA